MTAKRYDGIQVGRALAALMVVIFHAPLAMSGFKPEVIWRAPFIGAYGYYGVQFFFVLSGFIIYEVVSRSSFSPVSFIIKRFYRLWPTYAAIVTLFIAVSLVLRNETASAALMTPMRVFQTLIFWPMREYPVLPPGWSLEHEVIYYISAVVVAGLFGRNVFFWFLIAAFVGTVIWLRVMPGVWDYHLFSYLNSYFVIGAALRRYSDKLRAIGSVAPIMLGLAIFVTGCYFMTWADLQNTWQVQVLILGTASTLLIAGLLNIDRDQAAAAIVITGSPPYKWLVQLGDLSYSLYLVHFLWIPIFRYWNQRAALPDWTPPLLVVIFVAVSIATAQLCYRLLEQPSIRRGSQVAKLLERGSHASLGVESIDSQLPTCKQR